MSIVINPDKEFINIRIYYIEEPKEQGISVFNFIKNKDEFQVWTAKGYKTEEDLIKEKLLENPTMQHNPQNPIQVPKDANDGKVIREIHSSWRRMTWAETNQVWSQCLKQIAGKDGAPKVDFDGIKYRELKLKKCLKGWNVRDDSGNPIPLTPESIDNLIPEAARELLDNFEKVTETTEKE